MYVTTVPKKIIISVWSAVNGIAVIEDLPIAKASIFVKIDIVIVIIRVHHAVNLYTKMIVTGTQFEMNHTVNTVIVPKSGVRL